MAVDPLQQMLLVGAGTTASTVAGGGAVVGSGAVVGLLSSAGVTASIPVAGWIVSGGLLAATGVIALVKAFKRKGRKEAMAYAESLGLGGKAFAREYAKMAGKSNAKVQARASKLSRKVAKKLGKGKSGRKRTTTLVDKLNADRVILYGYDKGPNVPAIAGDRHTIEDGAADMELAAMLLGAGAVIGLAVVLTRWRAR